MGQGYYRQIKTKKLIALLIRYGFISLGGTKHGKYARHDNSQLITIPRHAVISSGTSKQICEALEKQFNIPKEDLKKLF